MIQAYLVTEGSNDNLILRKLLPEDVTSNIEIVTGKGSYSAQSLARTLLVTRNLPVALVIDADGSETQVITEKKEFLHQMFSSTKPTSKFEVFIASPNIESVLLYSKSVLERVLNRNVPEDEWRLAQNQPVDFLKKISQDKNDFVREFLRRLTEEDAHNLQKHPLIRQITDFLTAVSQPVPTP